uniref:PDZ domain-containing protein n=1 Tax=Panagrellus redivivus TaxID=6233 RepID=A0A7E4VHQ0_PANRE
MSKKPEASRDDAPTNTEGEQILIEIPVTPSEGCGLKVSKDLDIMAIVKGSPGEGKFCVGDMVQMVNNTPITSLKDWETAVAKGGTLAIVVGRGLKTTEEQVLPPAREKNVTRREGFLYQITTIEHQRGCKFGLGIKHYQNKVIVSRVDEGSLSAKSLIAGDRIVDVNGTPVSDKDVARDLLLKSLQKTKKVSLVVERAVSEEACNLAKAALIASELQPPSVAMASDIRDIVARQKERMTKEGGAGKKKGIMRSKSSNATAGVVIKEEKKEHIIASDNEGKALKKVGTAS